MPEKKDFFGLCDRDDSNLTNPCKECKHFVCPVGCVIRKKASGYRHVGCLEQCWYVFTCWLKSKFKRKDVQK